MSSLDRTSLGLLLGLTLAACGGGEPSTDGAQAAADDEISLEQTRFVDELPTYESVPLPEGLEWITNLDDPEFASPEAKRGGRFSTYDTSFPLTLRTEGPDSNGTFAGLLRSSVYLSLTAFHPNTLRDVPVLATHWAFGEDGKTIYFKLNPDARWSDGYPITADDYVFMMEFMRSEYIVAPWYNNEYTENIVAVRKHDDYTISVEGAVAKPREDMLYSYGYGIAPKPRHFHKLDENWVRDYNWRAAPGPGPYRISEVVKGQYITFERVEDWWGDDVKYLRNRFNPDEIRVTVIRDMNVAWEYFLRGEIDAFRVTFPNYWHEKAQGPQFDNGYIHKLQFYNDLPRTSYGMWLNEDDPVLADQNVRLGLAYSMNVERLLATVLRGDYDRLRQHYDGYWDYTNPDIVPRDYDLDKAEESFSAAGWSERGSDGIRVKDGQRLSFDVVYGYNEYTPRLVFLREEARKAGVELNLQLMDASAYFKHILEKKHQIGVMGWGSGIRPAFWEHYHSDNAHKTQTNNITNTDDPEIDRLIDAFDDATDRDERIALSHRIQQMIYDQAAMIPLWKAPYARDAYWRWIKMPEQHATRTAQYLFDPPLDEPLFLYDGLFWIDEETKAETIAARQAGRTFEPVTIIDTTWRVE